MMHTVFTCMRLVNKSRICLLVLLQACMLPVVCGASEIEPLDGGWKKLTLREKIGQTVIMRGESLVRTNMSDAALVAYLIKYPVGGVFDGGTVIFDSGPTAAKIGDRIARLRKASAVPL